MSYYEISTFMKYLLTSKFPQFSLLLPKKFCDEAKKRGIIIQETDLEYFDKIELIRPCLRLNHPMINNKPDQLQFSNSPYDWKYLYRHNYVELLKKGDFILWKRYYTRKKEEETQLYYHPSQLLFLNDQLSGMTTKIKTRDLINPKINIKKYITLTRKQYKNHLKIKLEKNETSYDKIIGLCMLLEEPYSLFVKHEFYDNPNDDETYSKWYNWQKKKRFSKTIHKKSGFTIKELKSTYEHISFLTNTLDPLNKWNPFMSLVRRKHKRKLKGNALLAQDLFEMLKMISLHIKDLTGRKMLDPSDSSPWINNGWKEMLYGTPYNINSLKTTKQVLSDYLVLRPINTSLIVEGKTEEKVIRKIMSQVEIHYPEEQGIHIYNLRGSGNMTQKNIDGYITRSIIEKNEIYVILDQDAKKYLNCHLKNKTLDKKNVTIWDKDFEDSNFGVEFMVSHINKLLKKHNVKSITVKEVKQECVKRKLFDAIRSVIYKNTKLKLESDIISKPNLSLYIMNNQFQKIHKDYRDNEWKPKYPIEKVMKAILRKIPRYAY